MRDLYCKKIELCAPKKNDVASKFVLITVFSVEIEEVSKLRRKKPKHCDRCRIRFRYRKQNKNNIPIESTSITSHIMFLLRRAETEEQKNFFCVCVSFPSGFVQKANARTDKSAAMWAWYHRTGFFDKLTLLRRPRMN